MGTGGIKPCVSAFGGDQFHLPEQARQLARFFSLFYFAINAGSMISTSLTPILRQDVHCFGERDCFSVAFGVPAILMLLSVVIFIAGKRLYILKPPAGNMIFGVSKCIVNALSGWKNERKSNPRKHWLDYAEPTCGSKMVSDTKTLMKILVLYLPFPVFWALFDQQGSRWTFQATRMNGELSGYVIKPDQMQVVNPLLILGFIPLFDWFLYPLLAKFGIRRPLQKLTMGGLLAALAFVLSGLVELKINATEQNLAALPNDLSNLRIYNGMSCNYRFTTDIPEMPATTNLKALSLWEKHGLPVKEGQTYNFAAISSDSSCPNVNGVIKPLPGKSMSYYVIGEKLIEFEDSSEKSKTGAPIVRVMINSAPDDGLITLTDADDAATQLEALNVTQTISVANGQSTLTINGKTVAKFETKIGGVYVVLVDGNVRDGFVSIFLYNYYIGI